MTVRSSLLLGAPGQGMSAVEEAGKRVEEALGA
jgi:hypothetical protein